MQLKTRLHYKRMLLTVGPFRIKWKEVMETKIELLKLRLTHWLTHWD